MRGAGRQLLASILNLITYWGLGLPLSTVLGLHYGLGVQGLWWGLATTTTVQVTLLTLFQSTEAQWLATVPQIGYSEAWVGTPVMDVLFLDVLTKSSTCMLALMR